MDIKNFFLKFAEAIEIDGIASLDSETKFRELPEWDSLAYLSIIAMLDEEYGVQIEESDFKSLNTLGEIVSYIEAHKG